ncbi:MAG: phage tail protein [Gammaproteobacteria bacterium]|nr:phage tail protein [Gammaproteobacteria bacterium]
MSDVYDYPLQGFRFQVDFKEQMLGNDTAGGEVVLCSGAFSECSGLEVTMEPKSIEEGGRNWGAAQRMGAVKFGTVVLKRGLTQTDDLWAWFNLVGEGAYAQRLNVSITLFDQAGKGVFTWTLKRALPTKFKAPDLNASNNEVAIEELHLVHEGLARVAAAVKQL